MQELATGQQREQRQPVIPPPGDDEGAAIHVQRGKRGDRGKPGQQIVDDMIGGHHAAIGRDAQHRQGGIGGRPDKDIVLPRRRNGAQLGHRLKRHHLPHTNRIAMRDLPACQNLIGGDAAFAGRSGQDEAVPADRNAGQRGDPGGIAATIVLNAALQGQRAPRADGKDRKAAARAFGGDKIALPADAGPQQFRPLIVIGIEVKIGALRVRRRGIKGGGHDPGQNAAVEIPGNQTGAVQRVADLPQHRPDTARGDGKAGGDAGGEIDQMQFTRSTGADKDHLGRYGGPGQRPAQICTPEGERDHAVPLTAPSCAVFGNDDADQSFRQD